MAIIRSNRNSAILSIFEVENDRVVIIVVIIRNIHVLPYSAQAEFDVTEP